MGNQALAYGLVAAAHRSQKELFYASYPITPASDILHELSKLRNFGVCTFQAEDEIAAVCSAIGAAYGGQMAVTTSSGPGIALKAEAMGLGIMLELPMLVIDVQRGGPSTDSPPRRNKPTSCRSCMGGTEKPLCLCSPPVVLPIVSPSCKRPGCWRPA